MKYTELIDAACGEKGLDRALVYAVVRTDEPEDSPARILFNYLQTEECRDLIEAAGYVRLAAQ